MSQPFPSQPEQSTDTIVYGTTADVKIDTQTAYLGHALNYWRFNVKEGLDLTRNGKPEDSFTFTGTDKDGAKTVPVKLDNKNRDLGHRYAGLEATRQVEKVITASHAAGVQVIYLNWAMTRSELKKLPPSTIYGYGRESLVAGKGQARGPGYPKGNVTLPNGQMIDAGDMYIQGTWNAEL